MGTAQPWTQERLVQAGKLYKKKYGMVPNQSCFYPKQALEQARNAERRAAAARTKATQARERGDTEAAQSYDQVAEVEQAKADEREEYARRYEDDQYWPAAATIIKRFGKFDNFLTACGFEPSTRSVTTKLNKFEQALATHMSDESERDE